MSNTATGRINRKDYPAELTPEILRQDAEYANYSDQEAFEVIEFIDRFSEVLAKFVMSGYLNKDKSPV